MSSDPIDIALREITETKHLLQALIKSSESFDHDTARIVLECLQKKVRHLGKLQAELSAQREVLPDGVLQFPASLSRPEA